ncbi:hypothetical protein AB3N59_15075 [Leptospira sp. WS92.C1]
MKAKLSSTFVTAMIFIFSMSCNSAETENSANETMALVPLLGFSSNGDPTLAQMETANKMTLQNQRMQNATKAFSLEGETKASQDSIGTESYVCVVTTCQVVNSCMYAPGVPGWNARCRYAWFNEQGLCISARTTDTRCNRGVTPTEALQNMREYTEATYCGGINDPEPPQLPAPKNN